MMIGNLIGQIIKTVSIFMNEKIEVYHSFIYIYIYNLAYT